MNIFGSMPILWILFGGHRFMVISIYFRVVSQGKYTELGHFLWGLQKFQIIFWGARYGVNSRCWAQAYV